MGGRPWTTKEINLLKQHYGKKPMNELEELLPRRTLLAIDRKARALGLKTNRAEWNSPPPPHLLWLKEFNRRSLERIRREAANVRRRKNPDMRDSHSDRISAL